MFSGIIVGTGRVADCRPHNQGVRLVIEAPDVLGAPELGASIAVNGVCLTVAERAGRNLSFDAVGATLRRTQLGDLVSGDQVNLEPALPLGAPVDGHFVSGHVDGLAVVTARRSGEGAEFISFEIQSDLQKQVALRGSVAVDGVSLTVSDVSETEFTVSLVPFTLERTTLSELKPGSRVHLETDVLAKYVQRVLEFV